MAYSKVSTVVNGAGSATLATAVSNVNTAVGTALTNALGVANSNNVQASPTQIIWDGTLYIGFATISYTVTS